MPERRAIPLLTIEHMGQRRTISEWASITGIPHLTIRSRMHLGWTPEQILTPQKRNSRAVHAKLYTYDGEQRGLDEIAALIGMDRWALRARLRAGETIEQATSRPARPRRKTEPRAEK